ncbi:sensor histidine kinase [Bacillus sp. CGMCC 1.16607]|uniref:sensor histidine kinase n=1 Tax=Bacillus sp. CGMCC 1.16607 TaxID=3351842 RepID=UPI003635AA01
MSTLQRQVLWGVGFSILMMALLFAAFFFVFPITDWWELWERDIADIPFLLFIPAVSVGLGVSFGLLSGLFWRKNILSIDRLLHQLEEGVAVEIKEANVCQEVDTIYKRIEKIYKQITEKAKISQKMATEKVEDQEQRIQEIISQERNRLARELHDSVSQQLFAASMMMSAINETKPVTNERETKQLKMVEEMIHQSQLEMRALLLHLRPVALKGKTLQEGIAELLIELSQKVTMEIQWKVEDISLDKGIEDHLFRILQESVSNTLRHSKASKLEVLLIKRDDLVIMRVVDDGVGFEVEDDKAGSYGMQNMHERAVEVGGTLKVISIKDKGTRLEVKVPITYKGEDDD